MSSTYTNAESLTHWAGPGIKPASSWILVGFTNLWATTGTPRYFTLIVYLLVHLSRVFYWSLDLTQGLAMTEPCNCIWGTSKWKSERFTGYQSYKMGKEVVTSPEQSSPRRGRPFRRSDLNAIQENHSKVWFIFPKILLLRGLRYSINWLGELVHLLSVSKGKGSHSLYPHGHCQILGKAFHV